MSPEHDSLLKQLHAARRPSDGRFDPKGYLGTPSVFLNVPVPARRKIAKAWLKDHRGWVSRDVLALVDGLVRAQTHEEKTLGLLILEGVGPGRRPFGPEHVDRWLDSLVGWAEVDSLCQSTFGPEDLLGDWPAWSGFIRRLARDPNINKRRAALVLLVKPAGKSPDPRLPGLAFEIIETLKPEREVIITKAVSWLLRALAVHHAAEVGAYLHAQGRTLPSIAVRETRAKLATGRKTPPKPA